MKLTVTMVACLAYVHENGGTITRHQGGFWAKPDWNRNQEYYGTTTIEALVARGKLKYTEFKNRVSTLYAPFPVEATLVEQETA